MITAKQHMSEHEYQDGIAVFSEQEIEAIQLDAKREGMWELLLFVL